MVAMHYVEIFLLMTGLVILLGFGSRVFFEKTGVPDVLILMGFGVALGHSIPSEVRLLIYEFAPYFGTLALIMILFEGGLHVAPGEALSVLRPAVFLSLLSFVVTTAVITALMHLSCGWEFLPALLLGVALGCTSSAIVIPVAGRISMRDGTRALVNMEAAFSDTFAIVALVAILDLAGSGGGSPFGGAVHLARSIGIAAAAAAVIGFLWAIVLEYTKDRQFSYLLTFAVLVLLYGMVEALEGSGAIAVFGFGVLVTEAKHLPRWIFRFKETSSWIKKEAHETMQWFHEEMTFLVRTFFFVYLGLLFEAERLTPVIVWVSLALSALILAGKGGSVALLSPMLKGHPRFLTALFMPRGLVSAVLASMAISSGAAGPARLLDYVVPVILVTNVAMSLGLMVRGLPARMRGNSPAPDAGGQAAG